jgi:membrane associated rhomboid family serine protease
MRHLGRFSIALLCSLTALVGSYYFGSLFLLLFDSNYHDGFAAVGGLIIGLLVAVVVFWTIWKKLSTWAHMASDQSS